jgi:hypothetical protein
VDPPNRTTDESDSREDDESSNHFRLRIGFGDSAA